MMREYGVKHSCLCCLSTATTLDKVMAHDKRPMYYMNNKITFYMQIPLIIALMFPFFSYNSILIKTS